MSSRIPIYPIVDNPKSSVLLAVQSFFAKSKQSHGHNVYSKASQTPSHHIIGRFQRLKTLHKEHPNLCAYLDIIKGKHDQLFLISTRYSLSLDQLVKNPDELRKVDFTEIHIKSILFQILDALVFLNQHQIIHRKLSLSNIFIDEKGRIKLSDYGFYHVTKFGSLVSFPIGDPRYMSPEAISEGILLNEKPDSNKSDIWSLGIILFELITALKNESRFPWNSSSNTPYKILLEILNLVGHDVHVDLHNEKLKDLESADIENLKQKQSEILQPSKSQPSIDNTKKTKLNSQQRNSDHQSLRTKSIEKLESLIREFSFVSKELKDILLLCLTADPMERCTPLELIRHPYFDGMRSLKYEKWVQKPLTLTDILNFPLNDPLRIRTEKKIKETEIHRKEELEKATMVNKDQKSENSDLLQEAPNVKDPVNDLTIEELFHIWCQGSGDIEGELAPELKISPSILRIPLFVRARDSTTEILSAKESNYSLQQHLVKDDSRRFRDKAVLVPIETLCYLAERNSNWPGKFQFSNVEASQWPLDVKERDLDYQASRIALFKGLLKYYPNTKNEIIREARTDIPPILRAEIWAAILGVPSIDICQSTYNEIDKDSEGPADRQIELDVPRCHQYHELLSSPEGHHKLKRVLKAWVKFNPKLGYWQGVDSFLAPFLVQSFNNEALAFWCLQKAVEKFSRKMFDREHSVYLQEHLQIFKQLLSYHDPKLSIHLHRIGFQPALYAIPWFLTLFTQFFSLDQIARLWDRVLLASSQLPFYLAYSMMKQLREILLPLDFNSCILLFSSLPGVDIENFINEATLVAKSTPSSITMPNYTQDNHSSSPNPESNNRNIFESSQGRNSRDRWWEVQVSLEELSTELFPRLSVTDLASASKFQFLVLDIRDPDAFNKASFPGSHNVDVSIRVDVLAKKLESQRNKHIVIIGDRFNEGRKLANALVEHEVPHVSLLNGGIDALLADQPSLLSRSGLPPLGSV